MAVLEWGEELQEIRNPQSTIRDIPLGRPNRYKVL